MKTASGKAGEDHIAAWLEKQGYEILARNFHSRYGEIDIIAKREPYIAFVEVKARTERSLVSPFEAVTPQKPAENICHRRKSFCSSIPANCSPGSTRRRYICGMGRLLENAICQTLLEYNRKRRNLCALF